ncbi:MAG: MATE family efflux transporter [Longimicrobiales bacterium]
MTRWGKGRGGSVHPFIPSRAELREVLDLAVPVVVVQVGMMAMGTVDTVMVGHYSGRDLAAVALGNLYFFSAVVFPMGLLMALDPVVSQAVGARDERAVGRALQRGGVLALVLALPAALFLWPGDVFLAFLNQPEEVTPVAAGYARAAIPGIFPFLGFIVFRQTLQAMGRMAPIVWTILLANLANLFFNWTLIYGNLGLPEMGAVGSGWASSLCRWLMLVGLLVLAWPVLDPHVRPLGRDALQLRPLARMVRLGAPIGVQMGLEYGAFGTTGILMGWMGTVAMAGHQVALNLAGLTFMVPLGISQATAIRVGQGVGREDAGAARRAAGAGLLLGVAFMSGTALLFLTLPELLARAYSGETAVLILAGTLIPLAGIFQVFDGLQVVSSGILRGVGDTRTPMILNLLGFWCIGIPVGVWLGFRTTLGPVGLWWGLVLGLSSVSLLLLARVRTKMGQALARIIID